MFETSIVMGWVSLQEPPVQSSPIDGLFGDVIGGIAFVFLWWVMTRITHRLGCQLGCSCLGAVLMAMFVIAATST